MKAFWEQRYGDKEYAYGTEPNQYFKTNLSGLKPGKILMAAEGEGRNAVYAASQGWEVVAYDWSENAQKKAIPLLINLLLISTCRIFNGPFRY